MQFPSWLGVSQIKDLTTQFYNQNVLSIRNWWNDHDSGARIWTKVKVSNATESNDAVTFGQIYVGFQAPVLGTSITTFGTSSGVYQITNLVSSITPISASHRIKVTANFVAYTGGSGMPIVSLFRGSTDLDTSTNGFFQGAAMTSGDYHMVSICWIDSPASASSVTYSIKLKSSNGATTVSVGGGQMQTMVLEEIV